MKSVSGFLFTIFLTLPALSVFGQNHFNNCTAAFLGQKIVVDQYSPEGKCVLPQTATGELTVCTADLSPERSIAKDKIAFKIAIRDKNTGTLVMYSSDTYRKIDIQKVLAQCSPGDRIVLLTMDREYALPHNEILVQ
jgi:hypothetical protein